MENVKKILLESKWRINRAKYWGYNIAISLFIIVLVSIFSTVLNPKLAFTITMILYIPLIYVTIILAIKRLHDLNKSGWFYLLAFVPIVNIYIIIITLFFKWTIWKNRFGEDPLKNEWIEKISSLTKIEL